MLKKIELLAPAGNLEKLKIAIHYGADAVYLAGQEYGLRAFAGNFTRQEMAWGLKFAHERGVKVYVTVNIFAHNQDLVNLADYLKQLEDLGVDGLIFADPGVWYIARSINSKLNLHLSTQANTTNWASAQFWQECGLQRIILARELSLAEIKEIKEKVNLELEVFVHGAMCISYSGRCLLSNYLTGRDANLGECAQPCRWSYALVEEKRPGETYPLEEDERGSYIFNAQDLCLLRYLPELIQAGVTSLKIEGRMKSVHYVATVVGAYRRALDAYFADPQGYVFDEDLWAEVQKVTQRQYTTGFLWGKPKATAHNYTTSLLERAYDFIGLVLAYEPQTGLARIEQRNNFGIGDKIEIVGPQTKVFQQRVTEMYDQQGHDLARAAHPQMVVQLKVIQQVKPGDLLRKIKDEEGENREILNANEY